MSTQNPAQPLTPAQQAAQTFGGPSTVTGPYTGPATPYTGPTAYGTGPTGSVTNPVPGQQPAGSTAAYGTPPASGQTAYGTGGTPAPSPTPAAGGNPYSSLGQFSAGMTDDQVRALANQYITAGGAQNTDNGQYWVNAYHQFGATDPSYFQTRLEQGITQNVSGGSAAAAAPAGGGAYVPGQGVPGQGTVFGPSNPLTGQTSALEGQMLAQMTAAEAPVTSTDPIIQSQMTAANAQYQQAARNSETQAAESGGPNYNPAAQDAIQNEQIGQSSATMEGTLMSNERTQRIGELQNIMGQYSGMLTQEQSMQLQEELSQLQLANGAINQNDATLNTSGNPATA